MLPPRPFPRLSARAHGRTRRPGRVRALMLLFVVTLVTGCGLVRTGHPTPTPADFPGIATILGQHGIRVANVTSGDPGCPGSDLAPTAIRFDATGLDQDEPARVYLYIFRNRDTFLRRRADVDTCARSYVTDPATFASLEASPFVLAGQGPWAPQFAAELRAALTEAAGSGG